MVTAKDHYSDATLAELGAIGVRSYLSEPARPPRCLRNKKAGETLPEKPCEQQWPRANRRIRKDRDAYNVGLKKAGCLVLSHQNDAGGRRRVRVPCLIFAIGCSSGWAAISGCYCVTLPAWARPGARDGELLRRERIARASNRSLRASDELLESNSDRLPSLAQWRISKLTGKAYSANTLLAGISDEKDYKREGPNDHL